MDYPIEIPGFEQQKLVWKAGMWSNSFMFNGQKLKGQGKKRNEYSVKNDAGEEQTLTLNHSFGDSVPTVTHQGETYHLAEPISTGKKVFAGLLHAPLLAGGAVGGACGAGGFVLSLGFFRSKHSAGLQYLMVFGSAVAAWATYFCVAYGVQQLMG